MLQIVSFFFFLISRRVYKDYLWDVLPARNHCAIVRSDIRSLKVTLRNQVAKTRILLKILPQRVFLCRKLLMAFIMWFLFWGESSEMRWFGKFLWWLQYYYVEVGSLQKGFMGFGGCFPHFYYKGKRIISFLKWVQSLHDKEASSGEGRGRGVCSCRRGSRHLGDVPVDLRRVLLWGLLPEVSWGGWESIRGLVSREVVAQGRDRQQTGGGCWRREERPCTLGTLHEDVVQTLPFQAIPYNLSRVSPLVGPQTVARAQGNPMHETHVRQPSVAGWAGWGSVETHEHQGEGTVCIWGERLVMHFSRAPFRHRSGCLLFALSGLHPSQGAECVHWRAL